MGKHWISQLAHVEILTPKPDESLQFFKDVLGLEESARDGRSIYLRGWGEAFHHSIVLTEAAQSGLGHVGWRADGPEALAEAVKHLEKSGSGDGWHDHSTGHGPSYRFRSPNDHHFEIFWEVDWYRAPDALKSPIKNHPQKYVGRGAAVRRLDHVNLYTTDVPVCREFHQDLGFRYHEAMIGEDGRFEIGAWLAVTNLSHDIAYVFDPSGVKGRLNHLAFAQDTREEVMRTADILVEQDVEIEAGPARHGISEAFFMYFHEPGGNRIEVYSGGYLNFAPDWGPIKWSWEERAKAAMYWSGDLPASNFTEGTPPAPVPVASA